MRALALVEYRLTGPCNFQHAVPNWLFCVLSLFWLLWCPYSSLGSISNLSGQCPCSSLGSISNLSGQCPCSSLGSIPNLSGQCPCSSLGSIPNLSGQCPCSSLGSIPNLSGQCPCSSLGSIPNLSGQCPCSSLGSISNLSGQCPCSSLGSIPNLSGQCPCSSLGSIPNLSGQCPCSSLGSIPNLSGQCPCSSLGSISNLSGQCPCSSLGSISNLSGQCPCSSLGSIPNLSGQCPCSSLGSIPNLSGQCPCSSLGFVPNLSGRCPYSSLGSPPNLSGLFCVDVMMIAPHVRYKHHASKLESEDDHSPESMLLTVALVWLPDPLLYVCAEQSQLPRKICFKTLHGPLQLTTSLFHTVPISRWLSTAVRPVVTTEWQLLFILHLLGPILNRLTSEKPKLLLEVWLSAVCCVSHHMTCHVIRLSWRYIIWWFPLTNTKTGYSHVPMFSATSCILK